jgi:hypothetical protein
LLSTVFETFSQSVIFPDDEKERGYYNRPYKRYEAEPGKCVTTGTILEPTFVQTESQSEASNQIAVQLIKKDSYIQWTNDESADGLTIRFSIPDDEEGTGTKGIIALYVNDIFIRTITLDSYWAWQYFLKNMSNVYPDNTPASNKFPRMRFDELHVKLENKIPSGALFKLVIVDDNDIPYTIDFVELENVPQIVDFESLPDLNKVKYTQDKGNLSSFINANSGKTIYLPQGKYESNVKITINGDGTKLIGAGMWYTEIYFTASSDDRNTFNRRGIESYSKDIVIDGLFLNTINNKRYYNNNSSYQVGKGLMGSFGSNSVIKNVWAEHFECGAWIESCDNLKISDCRFRNNYADGINLAYGSVNSIVENCSYRNNGDDDIATWSPSGRSCDNNIFRYSTSENNWRASGLGFFGGKQNKAHHIVIIDPMEAGFRITCDFAGVPFSTDGFSEFHDISVYKGGVKSGSPGTSGDLWGNQHGALHINSSSQYDLQNIKVYRIDLYDSKNDAIFIGSNSKYIRNLILNDINIDGTQRYGILFNNARGDCKYCNIKNNRIGTNTNTNAVPSTFNFIEDCSDNNNSEVIIRDDNNLKVLSIDGKIVISGCKNSSVSIYDILGRKNYQSAVISDKITIPDLKSGIYIVKLNNSTKKLRIIN